MDRFLCLSGPGSLATLGIALILGGAGAFLITRALARRIGRSDQAVADRLHRLQRVTVVASMLGQIGVLVPVLAWLIGCDADRVSFAPFLVPIAAVLAIGGIPLVLALATLPTYRRLRGLEDAPKPRLWRIPLMMGCSSSSRRSGSASTSSPAASGFPAGSQS